MKILIITQWFDPEPTFKGLLFAKSLIQKGHQVDVITGFPNYPGGKIYDGYKIKLYQKEIIDDVVIHRVPLYPSHDASAFKRILNYVSFGVTSLICGLCKTKKVDVIYSYHPPLTASLSAMCIGFFRRTPFVIDVQDLWPDTLAATGMLNNSKALHLIDKICQLVYRRAAKIVVLSPGFKKQLISRNVPSEKIKVIYNWCDEEVLTNFIQTKTKLPNNGSLNLVFAGNLGMAQGLPSIINAAKILQEKKTPVNVVFIGDGISKEKAENQVESNQLNNVFFLPRVPMNEIGSILSQADFLLVHLIKNELFSITIPSRTQAYLAMSKPIIMAVSGDAADIIKNSNSGVCCEPDNPVSLAEAIISMANLTVDERKNLAENAYNYYTNYLSVDVGVEHFISVFEEAR